MKRLPSIYIMAFLLLASFVFNYEADKSSYSLLLGNIRLNQVDKALRYLPGKQTVNILKMCIEMNKAKEDFSLTSTETAYLVFKWISQNIDVDCSNYDGKYISANTAYNSGRAGFVGFSNLFLTLCLRLNIHTEFVNGHIKAMNNTDGKISVIVEHAWNFIEIDNKYYLVDATLGTGTCDGKSSIRKYNDFYFATTPEYFIRNHYPEFSEFQFLDKPISFDQFKSNAFLRHYFYYSGFKTIEPDKAEISLLDDSTITFTYDTSIPFLTVAVQYITFDGKDYHYNRYYDLTFSKGMVKVSTDIRKYAKDICGLIVFAGTEPGGSTYSIALFNVVYSSKKISLNLRPNF